MQSANLHVNFRSSPVAFLEGTAIDSSTKSPLAYALS
jgi:hypothetical protein